MSNPSISVIMPAYNCGRFLREAIDSILNQTYRDFELIIVNDGSTDNTPDIIRSYHDERIVILNNEKNLGLIRTLNKAIDHARGNYIARMDADDISLPNRLQSQFDFFQQHPKGRVLATVIEFIDEKGNHQGYWDADKQAIDPRVIRTQLPKDNCIAHPTILCHSDLLKQYRYRLSQKNTEDYDLWLRLQADNVLINKLDQALLRYRVLGSSITRSTQKNVFWKNAKTKLEFVGYELRKGKFNSFIGTTLFYGLLDILKGFLKEIKRMVKG